MADKTALKNQVCEAIDRHEKKIVDLGEAIMDDPELGFKEERTAGRVKSILREAGLAYEEGLALTGVHNTTSPPTFLHSL